MKRRLANRERESVCHEYHVLWPSIPKSSRAEKNAGRHPYFPAYVSYTFFKFKIENRRRSIHRPVPSASVLTRFVGRRMIDTCPMNTYTLHNVQHGGQNEFLGPRPSKVADGNVTKNPPSGWISACRRRPGPSTFSLCFKFDFLAAGMKCRACRRITGVCVSLSLSLAPSSAASVFPLLMLVVVSPLPVFHIKNPN